jgi:hypothetical protein
MKQVLSYLKLALCADDAKQKDVFIEAARQEIQAIQEYAAGDLKIDGLRERSVAIQRWVERQSKP